jgi:hypothetical protein
MSEVNMTVQLEHDVYVGLLTAANEAGLSVSEFASAVVANYVGENYGQV